MSTIGEALRQGAARLTAAGVPEALNDAALLLSHVTGEPPLNLRADGFRSLIRAVRSNGFFPSPGRSTLTHT